MTVSASSDYEKFGVAGTISGAAAASQDSLAVAAAPGFDLTFVESRDGRRKPLVEAYIGDEALVSATGDVIVESDSEETVTSIAAGITGGAAGLAIAVEVNAAALQVWGGASSYIGDNATVAA
ncbi:MAG: hypothetical protein AAFX76_14765, partial [Planctomycetota bacterium]